MKTLVIYYSFEGNTEYAAKELAKKLGADIQRIEPVNELKSKGFYKYIWGGRQAVMKKKPEIISLDKNPQDYDIVVIGSPVWASTYAPPIRSLLDRYPIEDKKIGLFMCHDGGPGKAMERLKGSTLNCEILAEIEFVQLLKEDRHQADLRISHFAQDIQRKIG